MSGQHAAAGASPGQHSLAFRVMRLSRPAMHADEAVLRLHPTDLFVGEDLLSDANPQVPSNLLDLASSDPSFPEGGEFDFRKRLFIDNPTDAMGLSGFLLLPQSFGAIYLGETFCSYISINNSSVYEARDVIIKAEIQTEKQRLLLLDTSKSPVESIRAGGRYDFIVEHDVKELGAHTLVCTALYSDGDSAERKYLPQFFKFVVANPLSVRTKVRTFKDDTFLEACIENHTKSNLYMDQVEFEPAPQWTATRLEADEHTSLKNSRTRNILKQPVFIRANGGICNYLYLLRPHEGGTKEDAGTVLGKFQITWRTNLGEPGRLQTRNIHNNLPPKKDIDLQVVKYPSKIVLEQPFSVHLCLTNQTERTVGPFEVYIASSISSDDSCVMLNGLQKLVLPLVEGCDSINFDLNMLATQVGVQRISGITVHAVQEKKVYDSLLDIEVFVDAE
ncbi:trafficking protein particle complex subunit 13 isoform X3 [Carex littledalei]|uniref:Trafficking protein particle complex subunit 13 isoform X3 n=1 Tax=Carex littledalei TaxID=544730 RepID=A0A833VLM0_9POAL|nr:trafficking protein particle complex subunit 13 isoform X3 [Carex littledalei]